MTPNRDETKAIVSALFASPKAPRSSGVRPVGAVLAEAVEAAKARHPSVRAVGR